MAALEWEGLSAASTGSDTEQQRDVWEGLSSASEAQEVAVLQPWDDMSAASGAEDGPENPSEPHDAAIGGELAIDAVENPALDVDMHGHGLATAVPTLLSSVQVRVWLRPVVTAVRDHTVARQRPEPPLAHGPAHGDLIRAIEDDREPSGLPSAATSDDVGVVCSLMGFGPIDPLNVPSKSAMASFGLSIALERAARLFDVAQQVGSPPSVFVDDSTTTAVVEHFVHHKANVASSVSEATMLGAPTKSVDRYRQLTAVCSWLLQGRDACRMVQQVVNDVVAAGGRAATFTEKYKSDEMSLRMRVSDVEDASFGPNQQALALRGGSQLGAVAHQSAVTKVLQQQRTCSALFELPGCKFLNITFDLLTPLGVMASTKCEVYYNLYKSTQLPWERVAERFDHHQVFLGSDGDTSVAASVRGIAQAQPAAAHLHTTCHIHTLSN